ncbi:DUF3644 domain-containing protein [Aeromonas dhakensis]|uniref:DUF3644 domain-containing protein n=1 Tax=Aeromonas dhakensis TaxID=196024 RepID=UPI00259DF808|nr:DUF3644 domain-containing protein [Aeromonas dhakensis]MDM5056825.1 DUF3644 domain-containing protein [Aeromonas dhakensis]MDM5082951.1 DUF3644 domain-containing protein [Aeromonas dhakensis]
MSKIKAQEKFYEFLKEKQKANVYFSKEDVISATGWKSSTFKSYLGKGWISSFIVQVEKDLFEAQNTLNINFTEFRKKQSQSKNYRELGHNCKNNLARALLKKSRDNMMLALELYNRPSLENKLDGFVMLFSTAWEQLLKAIIIELQGEKGIYTTVSKKGIKQTISLRQSLDKIFPSTENKIRKNIERISDWRDNAVHLLMPEIQGLASRVFQAGVINYSTQFEEFSEVPFLSYQHAGMLSLVGDFNIPPISILRDQYGDSCDEILSLARTLQDEIEENNDIDFAIPINVSLVYAKKDSTGLKILANANGSKEDLDNLRNALIVEKAVDPEKTHPYPQGVAVKEINKILQESYSTEKLFACLPARDKNSKPILNSHCFLSLVEKTGWKKNNNDFHHYQAISNRHLYSDLCIQESVKKITENDSFLRNAKKDKGK